MPKRHKLLAANWKMNPPPKGFDLPINPYRRAHDVDVVVFPSAIDIDRCVDAELVVGGQAARPEETGAFTGDASMAMLASHGCQAVLCGHSERRRHHGEMDTTIAKQARAAISLKLLPFVCVGETAEEREAGRAQDVVGAQLATIVGSLNTPLVVAYEPVWAIGTGKTPIPAEIQAMHAFIRSALPPLLQESPIIYGGSVSPENAADIFACEAVDGALVGGAALDPAAFGSILESLRSSPH